MSPTVTDNEYTDNLKGEYLETIGRRKTATARVRLYDGDKTQIIVNGQPAHEYFPTDWLNTVVHQPLEITDFSDPYFISVQVKGGGVSAQAQAVRHGLARAIVEKNSDLKKTLKDAGYLKRDSRMKERKKPGRKKARKSEQWSKR